MDFAALFAQDEFLPETGLIGRIVGGVTVAGLLGLLLYWLLFVHLPGQDAKILAKEKVQVENMKYLFEQHRQDLDLERAASERRHAELVKEVKEGQQRLADAVTRLAESLRGRPPP